MDRMSFGRAGEIGAVSRRGSMPLESAETPFPGLLARLAGPAPAEGSRIGAADPDLSARPAGTTASPIFDRPMLPVDRPPLAIDPSVFGHVPIGPIVDFPRFPLPFIPPPVSKTATQLAHSAIVNLTEAPREALQDAVNTITIKHPAAGTLLDYLERKVRVGEVLNQLAATWTPSTVGDFADAFQMDRTKTAVMDAIVSISILSNPKLDEEILAENIHDAAPQDVLDNRAVAWQWPAPGTVMTPPYLMLVAVEYRDVAQAEDVVQSIMGELVDHQGMKLPRAAAEKL